ncbi:MAG TPA: rRNA (cytidine-2'-O-)-methyltransferase, partial [Acidobacteria bacterium]|nr:rRNA (cytidine-2'-O-)-methyltransferase [Acidobacteriota bacterium]
MSVDQQTSGSPPRRRGRLFVVASPIGNLADISPRARQALEQADLVAAEDTRRTGRLLEHLGVRRPMLSCHRFNEARSIERLLEVLERGETLALISDGGTPTISDPGYRLVAEAARLGHQVIPIPGPSAVIASLSVAGLPADRLYFAGFL